MAGHFLFRKRRYARLKNTGNRECADWTGGDYVNKVGRFILIEAILCLLILMAVATTLVTEARFRQQRQVYDLARVARPVITVSRLSASADLGEMQPGSGSDFEFSVANGSALTGFSETGFDYIMAIQIQGSLPAPFVSSLSWIDAQDQAHACTAETDGTYRGLAPMGTTEISQRYRLRVDLPLEAVLPAEAQDYQVQIIVTAKQRDF